MTPNHLQFPSVDENDFLSSTRIIGPEGAKLTRERLSTSPLCRNSGSCSGRPEGAALTYEKSCCSVLHMLVSVLDSTCTKCVTYPIIYVVLHLHLWGSIAHESVMSQVFQLTALVIRGPATRGEKFIENLGHFAIKGREMRGVLLCVQDFVQRPNITQRSFFSESELTMFSEFVAIADSITSSSVYAPWNFVRKASAGQVMSDLCASSD